jgi:hypothetical protein
MILSYALAQAEKIYPYENDKGEVAISSAGVEGDNWIRDCKVNGKSVRYIGKKPICFMDATCTFEYSGAATKVETNQTPGFCPLSSPSDGCSSIRWQDCLMDQSIPSDLDIKKCIKVTSGALPTGCPQISEKATTAQGKLTPAKQSQSNYQGTIDISIKDDTLANPSLSQDRRSDGMIIKAREIQLSLRDIGCPSIITPMDLYGTPKTEYITFRISSKDCKIVNKSRETCEQGTVARNIPDQLLEYKACVKSNSSSSQVKSGTGEK